MLFGRNIRFLIRVIEIDENWKSCYEQSIISNFKEKRKTRDTFVVPSFFFGKEGKVCINGTVIGLNK